MTLRSDHSGEAPEREAPVVDDEADYGGIRWGAAFFGWLSAMGLAVLLTSIVAAVGAAVSVSKGTDVGTAVHEASQNASTVGLAGAVALAVILFVSYFCGGYVAGRMARFSGAKQGFGVWMWAVVVAILVAIAAAVAGSKYDILSALNGFPRLPVGQGTLTRAGIVTLVALLVVSLLGAVIGGKAGMRYHRRLDRAGAVVL